MFVDTLVKMRKKDKRIEELTAAAAAAVASNAAEGSNVGSGDSEETASLQKEVHPYLRCPIPFTCSPFFQLRSRKTHTHRHAQALTRSLYVRSPTHRHHY